jgi:DNA-directed RNA polymerase specialized sigma24 family protein
MSVRSEPAETANKVEVHMDREELLRRYPAHRGRLVASLARLVGVTDAEDLAEETLLRALAAVDRFRGEAALSTWLHRIGVNLAYDLLRPVAAVIRSFPQSRVSMCRRP